MSVLIRFETCIARPDQGERTFPLREHLVGVRRLIAERVRQHPVLKKDEVLIRLMELAGCCHDVAKAHPEWQRYIRNKDQMQSPVSHAPAGASLFSYLGYRLLHWHRAWISHFRYWYWLVRDIADHHGALKALDEDSWKMTAGWDQMDLPGIEDFFHEQFEELRQVSLSQRIMDDWVSNVDEVIRQAEKQRYRLERRNSSLSYSEAMRDLHLWRDMTTCLITADRFDIFPVSDGILDEQTVVRAEERIRNFCDEQRQHPLASERMKAQQSILRQLQETPNHRIFTLSMPTGYGKTITAMKIALWLARNKGCKKIIYVAPYISILEQTSDVVTKAMNLSVMEHHSLALWDENEDSSNMKVHENHEQRTSGRQLAMESWANEVICTSFQQFSKAVFPKRAQDVLRRTFLRQSIVLIDEPQIFSPEGWNTFLCGLESLAESNDLHVVFLSATMPPFRYGLQQQPAPLSYAAHGQKERYRVEIRNEPMDEKILANHVVNREEVIQGVILNTIEDAYLTFKAIKQHKPAAHLLLVHGLMIPLHKKTVIASIQHHLKYHRKQPLIVVSTQVLEAGVDVSFEHVARALAILPSIVQAAGRVNRHSEMTGQGLLTVFPFLRKGTINTRNYIYNNSLIRNITDQLLSRKSVWSETEIANLVQEYYQQMFQQNNYTTGMHAIIKAHRGQWPELSQFEPFGADLFRLPLFVPWQCKEEDTPFMPKIYSALCQKFGMTDPRTIYDCYMDKTFWRKRDFSERRMFMVLFQHHLLNLPVRLALKLVGKDDYLQNKIPYFNLDAYNSVTGLTGKFSDDSDRTI